MLVNEGATAEVEQPEEKPEIAIEKSMDDTIRETLRGLQEKGVTTDSTDAEKSPETPEDKAQRIRDTQGKFAAKEPAEESTPAVVQVTKPAPNTWRKEVAEKWSSLPPEVQAEVERRESDFHKGIESYRQKAQFAESMERSIQPHMETLRSLNVTPESAIKELLHADHQLRFGTDQSKQAYIAHLAQAYNIDLGQAQSLPAIDPNVSAMQTRIQQLEGHLQQQSLMGQQAEQEKLNSEISSFATDPTHSHFESVKGHMAALLQAGQAQDLASAYEQAVWANPQTRAAVLAEQQAAARSKANQTAQAAKQAASVNVRVRPSMPTSQPIGSMDDTIRSTLRRLQGA